jgi:hypothetical protein
VRRSCQGQRYRVTTSSLILLSSVVIWTATVLPPFRDRVGDVAGERRLDPVRAAGGGHRADQSAGCDPLGVEDTCQALSGPGAAGPVKDAGEGRRVARPATSRSTPEYCRMAMLTAS